MSERGCRSPTHRSRSATPSKRVLQKLRNKCSITPQQPLHYPRNGCSIWIGTGAPLRPEGALAAAFLTITAHTERLQEEKGATQPTTNH
jgi:hypothetical protein